MSSLLWYVLTGTRGGETRVKVLALLILRPRNAHQIAKELNFDYKTIQHHLKVLEDNNLIEYAKKGAYGAVPVPTPLFLEEKQTFNEIIKAFGMNLGEKPAKTYKKLKD